MAALTVKSPVTPVLNFIRHPGTNTGLGLALAALAQFTAAVPTKDRSLPTYLGFGYALATQFLDRFGPELATAPTAPVSTPPA